MFSTDSHTRMHARTHTHTQNRFMALSD